jgi:hypothetical protein
MPKREWREATVTVQCPADCPFLPEYIYQESCKYPDAPAEACDDNDHFPADCPLEVIATECPKCNSGDGIVDAELMGRALRKPCPKCGGLGVVKKEK